MTLKFKFFEYEDINALSDAAQEYCKENSIGKAHQLKKIYNHSVIGSSDLLGYNDNAQIIINKLMIVWDDGF